ncbi:uncharacterized protein LOC142241424 [Haematobia irritans]|uniref:uncharacterized protein LOC142224272 n=1 Tax=Haematobia irritans TaxID=7368 RepID=UPI003F502FA5
MPSHRLKRKTKPNGKQQYLCRLCRCPHALRKCRRFLSMNVNQREHVVKSYGYCINCLAHTHSEGSCFTRTGCKICHEKHHTLIHTNPRLQKQQSTSRKRDSTKHTKSSSNRSVSQNNEERNTLSNRSNTTTEKTSLSAILRQNSITLLPTIVVKIVCKGQTHKVRCLLDSGARSSYISTRIVDKLALTILTLDTESICPLTLISTYNPEIQLQAILKTNNRVSSTTPRRSVSNSFLKHFNNLVLADPEFYRSAPVDIVLGVDIYSNIVSEGILNRSGLPTAQNTIFGWTLYGLCSD